ncbi:hypothetical protein ACUIW7_001701, partial [Klebsiella pneumoniae]
MTQYNTGNPVPSSAMPDIWDNNATIDEFVNSPELTLTTRTGTERDTLAGIQKKSDDQRVQMAEDGTAVVEETRQNLIPLSRQYMTLAAAQADITNIPDGSSTYYRSPDDSALAVEVINNAGTLQPTGRKMPSQAAIQAVLDYISSLIATDDADSPLLTLNDEAGFRLAAFGLNAIQSNAMTAEYDEFIDGFVFRDSVGFVIQQIGTPLLSS